MNFNAKTTSYFKSLNVTPEAAKEAAAIQQTITAYNSYKREKIELEGEVQLKAHFVSVEETKISTSTKVADIEPSNYKSSAQFLNEVTNAVVKEETFNKSLEAAKSALKQAEQRLKVHILWGKAQGFDE